MGDRKPITNPEVVASGGMQKIGTMSFETYLKRKCFVFDLQTPVSPFEANNFVFELIDDVLELLAHFHLQGLELFLQCLIAAIYHNIVCVCITYIGDCVSPTRCRLRTNCFAIRYVLAINVIIYFHSFFAIFVFVCAEVKSERQRLK